MSPVKQYQTSNQLTSTASTPHQQWISSKTSPAAATTTTRTSPKLPAPSRRARAAFSAASATSSTTLLAAEPRARRRRTALTRVNSFLNQGHANATFLICFNRRHRLRPGELPWPGQAGQRECRRAGQGRADLGLHPWPVQEPDWQGLPHCGQIDWRWETSVDMKSLCFFRQGSVYIVMIE